MAPSKAFSPGDMVLSLRGEAGAVLSEEELRTVREHLTEGRRPGHYFAPGCCARPDYTTQVPVLFEDGRYDIMRPMGIRRAPQLSEGQRARLQEARARGGLG